MREGERIDGGSSIMQKGQGKTVYVWAGFKTRVEVVSVCIGIREIVYTPHQ